MITQLEQRLAELCAEGGVFSSDDLTANGSITIDPRHGANGRNNGIGSIFATHHRAGHIAPVGTKKSAAPHRKGGLIRTWQTTEVGRRWANAALRRFDA